MLPCTQHAFLSDLRSGALIGAGGSVDWWPGARFDGPSAFSALLDPDAGHFSLAPRDALGMARRYLPGTLVLETTHRTATGTLVVTDGLILDPGGASGDATLVRVVE